jgi:hypothetical protein
MTMKKSVTTAAAGLALLAGSASAQDYILMPDSTSDTVQKFSAVDGSFLSTVVTLNQPGGALTPIEAQVVGNEIWVSDQLQDNITAYDLATGAYIGVVVGPAEGLDNVRGFEVADGKIWVTCGAGTYNNQVPVFDQTTRAFLFAVSVGGGGFDAKLYNGEILVSNITTHDIDRIGFDGTLLGKFVDSTGADQPLDFPQQMYPLPDGSEVLVAEFSSTREIFRFDSAGTLIESIDTAPQGGMRGILRLANGDYMITNGAGAHLYNPASGVVTVYSGGGRYLTLVSGAPACPPDFNGDGFLDFFDYDDYVTCFETNVCPPGKTADFNNDSFVDFFDYDSYVEAFETGC